MATTTMRTRNKAPVRPSMIMCQVPMEDFVHDYVDEVDLDSLDDMSRQLRQEALAAAEHEPELRSLLFNTVLSPGVRTFEDAVACTVTYRLLSKPCYQTPEAAAMAATGSDQPMFCPHSLRGIIAKALENASDLCEAGHSMAQAVRLDAQAVCERDPAVDTLLEVVLFLKGFAALVCHRAAYYMWHTNKPRKSMTALWLQSQASAVFGLDIHPAATIGAGVLMDHGTGIVIGETATVGDGCTLLHGVTLGGTGKDTGDRHPKVGKDVLIGANASLLGNIPIGDGAKIGAGSIVLRPIPAHATAVGAPAKIIGRAREPKPASTMDETLLEVSQLQKSTSDITLDTAMSTGASGTAATAAGPTSTPIAPDVDHWLQETNTRSLEETDVPPDPAGNCADRGSNVDEHGTGKGGNKETGNLKPKEASEMDAFCPFREYTRMAKIAPPGTITFSTLQNLLQPEGCRSCQIGEIFFNLDERNVGYIKPSAFFSERTQQVLAEKTSLSAERVATLLADFRAEWRDNISRLKTNSERFSLTVPAPRDIPVWVKKLPGSVREESSTSFG